MHMCFKVYGYIYIMMFVFCFANQLLTLKYTIMKTITLICVTFMLFAFTLRAQVWDYTASTTPFIGAIDMSDAEIIGELCSTCTWDVYPDDYAEEGFPPFENFMFYDVPLEYFYINAEGILEVNSYLSNTVQGEILPSASTYRLQWGGNSDGKVAEISAKRWQIDDGPQVFTIQIKYQIGAASDSYGSDIQIHFIEYVDIIELNYTNIIGSTGSSEYCGINYGDGIHYTLIDGGTGSFPTVETTVVFNPGYVDELQLIDLDLGPNNFTCDFAPFYPTVAVLSKGTTPQSNFDIKIYVDDVLTETYTVTDVLEQYDYQEFIMQNLVELDNDGDMSMIRAEIDIIDEIENNVLERLAIDLLSIETSSAMACYGEPAFLEATGADNYLWVDANDPESVIYFGSESYTTEFNVFESQEFQVTGFTGGIYLFDFENEFEYVDHDGTSGDDRSGIAITPEYLYIVGDDNTVRMEAMSLENQTSLPIRDGIFSDLATGKIYTLYNSDLSEDLSDDYSSFPFTVNAIAEMDTDLAISDNIISLDNPFEITQSYGDNGVFAGEGIVLVKNGDNDNLYKIEIETGVTTNLGVFADLVTSTSENWAVWGVVEQMSGEIVSVLCPRSDEIERLELASGLIVETFTFEDDSNGYYPDDCYSIIYSPWTSRMYFHSETNNEDGGYFNVMASTGGQCPELIELTVIDPPYAGFDSDDEICNESGIILMDYIIGNPDAGGMWTDVDATGVLTDGVLDASGLSEGEYNFTYSVEATAPCSGTAEVSLVLNLNESPDAGNGSAAEVCQDQNPIFNLNETLDGSQDMYGYWTDDDGTGILNGSMVDVEDIALGDYEFSYHAMGFGACEEDVETVSITVAICAGVDTENMSNLNIYPNPSGGIIHINIQDAISNEIFIEIMNVEGQIVVNETIESGKMDISHLPVGIYTLKVVSDENTYIKKIVMK